MAISIDNYAFNESRIQTILNSKSLADAQRMGIIDYVMDFLRGWVKHAQIQKLFEQIDDLSAGPDSEVERLVRFETLRGLAAQHHLDKFRVDVSIALDRSAWSYTFSVGDRQIFAKENIALDCERGDYDVYLEAARRNSSAMPDEASHHAPATNVAALKRDMAAFLKEELFEKENEPIGFYLADAVITNLKDLAHDDPIWRGEPGNGGAFKRRMREEIFPHEDRAAVMEYLSGDRTYTDTQKSALIDLLVITDKEHQYRAFAEIYCDNRQLDFSKIAFADNHFYIDGKDTDFIPGDGNCLFHCLDYLQQQKDVAARISAYV